MKKVKQNGKVVNEKKLNWITYKNGERFLFFRKRLGLSAGSRNLGCSLYEVPPKKQSFPLHFHHSNEEAIFILSGCGLLRTINKTKRISEGDYLSLLPGPTGSHQLINNSNETLRYLCFSTMIEPDICEYPDSKKLIVFGETQSCFRVDRKLKYWSGEK